MKQAERTTYKLYAAAPNAQTIRAAERERFSRVTPGYALFYTNSQAPEDSVELDEKELHRLTQEDAAWVMQCAGTLLMERLEQCDADSMRRLSGMVDRLAEALHAQQVKLAEEERVTGDGDTERGTAESPV